MKSMSNLFSFWCFLYHILNVNAANNSDGMEESNVTCSDHANLIVVSTLDGTLTALDMNSGTKCWTVALDPEKFLSSTLSDIEIYENGQRVWLVPSLDGGLFKYDNMKLQPLPIDVDALISYSTYLDAFTSVSGGKLRVVYGIHRLTGEVIYTCKIDGCYKSKVPFPKNMLVVEEIISLVNAIDSKKGEPKWKFRVVELKLKVPSQDSDDSSCTFHSEIDKNALIPSSLKEFINMGLYKISLQHGFAGMLDKLTQKFLWVFNTSCPINDAWYVRNNVIKALDPFDRESGFFTVDMDDGKHTAMLFLGSYENQLYVKKSKKFILNTRDLSSVSTSVLYQKYLLPVCLKPERLGTNNDSTSHEMTSYSNVNVSEYGSYFYMNYSENLTHCIINPSNIQYDNSIDMMGSWFVMTAIIIAVIVTLCIQIKLLYEKQKRYVNASTSSVELPAPATVSRIPPDFKSRFYQDFELLAVLGKGGFGVVLDVKNKIDDCRYAVKRIPINEKLDDCQYEKVLREVKALAKLDHRGIVRYFNAWIEYPPSGWQELKDLESNIWDVSEPSLEFPSVSVKSSESLAISCKLKEKLNHNPLLPFENSFSLNNESCDGHEFSKDSDSTDESDTSSCSSSCSNLSGIIKWQKGDLPSKQDIKLGDISNVSNIFEESTSCTANDLPGDKISLMHPPFNLHKLNPKSSDFDSPCCSIAIRISEKHEELLIKLKMLHFAYPLDEISFQAFSKFFFHSTESDVRVIGCPEWIHFLDLLPDKYLIPLQKWLISILCIICVSKCAEFEFVVNNLCYILWDLNRKLEDETNPYLNNTHQFSETRSTESQTVAWAPRHASSYNICKSTEENKDMEKNISFSSQKSIKNAAFGFLYIQMQLCKKESLRDWLNRHCTEREYNKAIEIFKEIVDAVDYVHSCGLMHRDLKPSNIYFSMEGAIKIGDFGLATSSDIQGGPAEQTGRFSYNHTCEVGTEFYMSPEQKLKQDYDCKTDIYSLGIMFFELLVPFSTQSERYQALAKVRKLQFPDTFLQKFRSESALVKMLLNNDPKNRPTTNEVKEILSELKPS